ncbi:MAG: cation:proton antiporter domain-containing protein [Myxococcales bacterium]
MDAALVVGAAGFLLLTGYAAEWIFRRYGLPDVLLLMLVGLGLHLAGAVRPERLGLFGAVLNSLALVVILFEGALRLELRRLWRVLGRASLLALLNFIPAGVLSAGLGVAVGLELPVALSLGFALAATSTTVVLPLLPAMGLGDTTEALLSVESTMGDILSVVGALTVLGFARSGSFSLGALGRQVELQLLASLAVGAVAGGAWSLALRSFRGQRTSLLPTVAVLLVLYALLTGLGLNGAIGTFSFGLLLGNASALRGPRAGGELALTDAERLFFAELSFLLKVFFFAYLGAVIPFDRPVALVAGAGLGVVLMALRWPVAGLLTRPLGQVDRNAIRALGPRGLVAAVVAQLPIAAGWKGGERAAAVAFGAILATVAVTSIALWASRPRGNVVPVQPTP